MTKQAAPEQQKVEYIRTLGQAFHASQALYPKLPMFLCVFKNADRTKQLVAMVRFILSVSTYHLLSPDHR